MMKGSSLDLSDPALVMESELSSSELDFTFAFNDTNFSDRVLRVEISNDPVETATAAIADCKKRKRQEKVFYLPPLPGEQVLKGNQPQPHSVPVPYENHDQVLDFTDTGNQHLDENQDDGVRVKTLHVNSAILAAKSPFFYKLFSNGMMESEQRQATTIRINASEEDALMELLTFMYTNTLNITVPLAVFHVLIAADKFQVPACIRYCTSWLLRNFTTDSALLYLEQQLSHTDVFQPLIDAAKQYLVDRYKDIIKFKEEVMMLPLSGIEVILASDDLQVESEYVVYNFVLGWITRHCNGNKESGVVLRRLAPLIRFPYMTYSQLHKLLQKLNTSKHKEVHDAKQHILEALIFKAKPLHLQRQQSLAAQELNHRCFMERAYKFHDVKVLEFELPLKQCVVFLDLKREECANLFPSGQLDSQIFYLGGRRFFLSAECIMDQEEDSLHCFGLFLGMRGNSSVRLNVDYEFAARSRPKMKFAKWYKGNYKFIGDKGKRKVVGKDNLFEIPWNSFIAEDSILFIEGVLHLRAELTIKS